MNTQKGTCQSRHPESACGVGQFLSLNCKFNPTVGGKHLQFKLRPQFKFIFICASEVGSLVWELYNRHQYCRPNEGREECRIAASSATCKSGFSVRRLPGSF